MNTKFDMNWWSGRGDIRKMEGRVDETQFSGVESQEIVLPLIKEAPDDD